MYKPKFKTGKCSICGKKTDRYKYCDSCSEGQKIKNIKAKSKYKSKYKSGKCIRCGNETNKYKYCEDCKRIADKKRFQKYESKNRKKIRVAQRNRYKNNPIYNHRKKFANHKYYEENKILKGRIKLTPGELRLKRNEYARNYYPTYFKNNPSKKIGMRFRQRLWRLMNGIPVKYKMEKLIGCTEEELKRHIENQFRQGMGWHNHTTNGWHIDHIIQCFRFNLTNPTELKKCFHYTNLRPLWAKENQGRKKS